MDIAWIKANSEKIIDNYLYDCLTCGKEWQLYNDGLAPIDEHIQTVLYWKRTNVKAEEVCCPCCQGKKECWEYRIVK